MIIYYCKETQGDGQRHAEIHRDTQATDWRQTGDRQIDTETDRWTPRQLDRHQDRQRHIETRRYT